MRLAAGHPQTVTQAAGVPVSEALSRALGDPDPQTLAEVVGTLVVLAQRLTPAEPGPLARILSHDDNDSG